MANLNIDPALVEIAAKSIAARWLPAGPRAMELAEVAISAVFEELGLKVDDDNGNNDHYRLISRWIPKL